MASKTCSSSLALFLTLNILFFALVAARLPCPRRSKGDGSTPSPPSGGPGSGRDGGGSGGGWGGGGQGGGGPGGGGQGGGGPGGGQGGGGRGGGGPGGGGPGGGGWGGGGPGGGQGGGGRGGGGPGGGGPGGGGWGGGGPGGGGPGGGGGGGSTPSTPSGASCPREVMKFSACATVLKGLVNVTESQQPVTPCCSLLSGLVDLEAASCLCTALKANILGINLNIPISLSVLLNVCSRQVPSGFQCA